MRNATTTLLSHSEDDLSSDGDDSQGEENGSSSFLQIHHQACHDALGQPGIYSGRLHVDSQLPDGPSGIMHYDPNQEANIASYGGEWKQGYWHGNGTCVLENGDSYRGSFQRHQRHGQGTYQWSPERLSDTSEKQRSYSGGFVDNQRQGHGKYVWKTIAVAENMHQVDNHDKKEVVLTLSSYTGSFEKGQRQGRGVYASPSYQFTGEWWQGKYQGYGVLETYDDSKQSMATSDAVVLSTYKGYFLQGRKHGRGMEFLSNGTFVHDGLWKNDHPVIEESVNLHLTRENGNGGDTANERTGQSVVSSQVFSSPRPMQDSEGHLGLYKGIVENYCPQGVGTMTYSSENAEPSTLLGQAITEYEGFWQRGQRHGFGRLLYTNGNTYQGDFVHNLPQGEGEYKCADGRHYKGWFETGVPHTPPGSTTTFQVLYPNLDIYVGGYSLGQRSGLGKQEFSDGSYYQGEWKDGMYHGTGNLITENYIYKGGFARGVFEGTGCLRDDRKQQILYQGEWREGKPVENVPTISGELLEIPHPPLDAELWSRATPATENSSAVGQLVRKLSSRPLSRKTSPIPKGTVESPRQTTRAQASVPPESSIMSFSGLFQTLSNIGSTVTGESMTSNAAASKQESCKAVVDMAVSDGEENPGRYTGLLHVVSQRPHGVGRMVYEDGNRIHEGFWEYGHRQGHGRCLFVKVGDYHEGSYDKNLRHGPGKYFWKDGRQYIGTYVRDERQGNGSFTYPNGDCYEGTFQGGLRNGSGTFVFHQKQYKYVGEWADGQYEGSGTLEWRTTDGDRQEHSLIRLHRYQGDFQSGRFHGTGIETVDGVKVREGVWADGKLIEVVGELPHDDIGKTLSEVMPDGGSTVASVDDDLCLRDDDEEGLEQNQDGDCPAAQHHNRKRKSKSKSRECRSTLDQNYEAQRSQWRDSLEHDAMK